MPTIFCKGMRNCERWEIESLGQIDNRVMGSESLKLMMVILENYYYYSMW